VRGGVRQYVAQGIPQIDTEIGKKDHLWMETIHTRKHRANPFVKRRPCGGYSVDRNDVEMKGAGRGSYVIE
jgi:hypothetical protein